MTDNQTVASLRSEYRSLVIDWDAAQASAEKANRIFDCLQDCYKRLHDSEAGREAITGPLMTPSLRSDWPRGQLINDVSSAASLHVPSRWQN